MVLKLFLTYCQVILLLFLLAHKYLKTLCLFVIDITDEFVANDKYLDKNRNRILLGDNYSVLFFALGHIC